jgi:hypothetical protein
MKRLLTAGAAAILMMLAMPAVSNAEPNDYPPPSTTAVTTVTGGAALGELIADGWTLQSDTAGQSVQLGSGPATVTAGGTFTFRFAPVFKPGEPVFVLVKTVSTGQGLHASHSAFVQAPGDAPVTVRASAAGEVAVALSPSQPGTYQFTATGATSGKSVTATVVVKAAAAAAEAVQTPAAAGGLSYTGVNSTMITFGALGGGLALVIGAGLIWLGATKRRGSTHHA